MTKHLIYFIFTLFITCTGYPQGSDLDSSEFKSGLSIDEERDLEISLFEPWEGIEVDIPASKSLEIFVPEVRSQEAAENVGGWAVGYSLASTEWALITNQSNKAMITAFAYDPLYLNNTSSANANGCGGEVYLSDLCRSLVENGAKRLNIDQATCETTPELIKEHSLLDFVEMQRLTSPNVPMNQNVLSVKYAITNYHPVVFSMHIPQSFYSIEKDGLFRPSRQERDELPETRPHALTVVGFDDDLYGGAFRVVNSWGIQWGDQGYCWISYEDFHIFQEASYMIYTELKVPDLVNYGAESNGFGRQHFKKYGFFEGMLDEKGRPDKGIYMNEALKKGRGGSRYMKRLVKKNGGFLIYSEKNFEIPIAAVIY